MEGGGKDGLFKAPHKATQRTRHVSGTLQYLLDGFAFDEAQAMGNNDVRFNFAKWPVRN